MKTLKNLFNRNTKKAEPETLEQTARRMGFESVEELEKYVYYCDYYHAGAC